MKKYFIKPLLYVGALVLITIAGFIALATIMEYKPQKIEKIDIKQILANNDNQIYKNIQVRNLKITDKLSQNKNCYLSVNDTITLLSWNIGYAGLGDNMDFFMDGGQSVRDTKERSKQNLSRVIELLEKYADSLDFIFLQEVDIDSKRSYGVNQFSLISYSLKENFMAIYTPTFNVFYVPMPIFEPIGNVNSGLAIFTRHTPLTVSRIAYPTVQPWPVSLFHLKYAALCMEFDVTGGGEQKLILCNTHNAAYGTDNESREKECRVLSDFISNNKYWFVAGDWNSAPYGFEPSIEAQNNEFFSIFELPEGLFNENAYCHYDTVTHSVRYGYEPYNTLTTTTSIIDFALSSPMLKPIETKTLDLGFENSDHNPVVYKFLITI